MFRKVFKGFSLSHKKLLFDRKCWSGSGLNGDSVCIDLLQLKTIESYFFTVLEAGGAVKAKFLLKPALEILLYHFLASHDLLMSQFSVTVAEFSRCLEERLYSKFLASLNQSETLSQPLPLREERFD